MGEKCINKEGCCIELFEILGGDVCFSVWGRTENYYEGYKIGGTEINKSSSYLRQ